MIPIFHDAGREIQNAANYEPSEFLDKGTCGLN